MTSEADRPLYRARLSPHRSLTAAQARRIIVAIGLFSTLLSVPFHLMGAWPVVGFLGLDVAGLALAFALSFRAARAYEDIEITPLQLSVAKVSARGARREWRFNPLWVRLVRRDHEEFGLLRLALASRGRELEVANFLGPEARARLASDLARALAEARRGPVFDRKA
jgi:uncharacterized membrane protein